MWRKSFGCWDRCCNNRTSCHVTEAKKNPVFGRYATLSSLSDLGLRQAASAWLPAMLASEAGRHAGDVAAGSGQPRYA